MTIGGLAPKLKPLVRLLASDVDGECLGAARALGRVLSSGGASFHDLAAAISSDDLNSRPLRIVLDDSDLRTEIARLKTQLAAAQDAKKKAVEKALSLECLMAEARRLHSLPVDLAEEIAMLRRRLDLAENALREGQAKKLKRRRGREARQ